MCNSRGNFRIRGATITDPVKAESKRNARNVSSIQCNLLGRSTRLLIIRRRPDLAGHRLGGRLLELLAFRYGGLLLGLGILLIVTVTEAERVVFGYGGRFNGGQGLPLAGLAAGRGVTLVRSGRVVEVIDFDGRAVLEGNPPTWGGRRGLLKVGVARTGRAWGSNCDYN